MIRLTQPQYDALVVRWNSAGHKTLRQQATRECATWGHYYAIAPLIGASGERVLVCTHCLKYVTESKGTER